MNDEKWIPQKKKKYWIITFDDIFLASSKCVEQILFIRKYQGWFSDVHDQNIYLIWFFFYLNLQYWQFFLLFELFGIYDTIFNMPRSFSDEKYDMFKVERP